VKNRTHNTPMTPRGTTVPLVPIGAAICVAAVVVIYVLAPDEVEWEDDTLTLFGQPVAGKRGILFRWSRGG